MSFHLFNYDEVELNLFELEPCPILGLLDDSRDNWTTSELKMNPHFGDDQEDVTGEQFIGDNFAFLEDIVGGGDTAVEDVEDMKQYEGSMQQSQLQSCDEMDEAQSETTIQTSEEATPVPARHFQRVVERTLINQTEEVVDGVRISVSYVEMKVVTSEKVCKVQLRIPDVSNIAKSSPSI